MLAIFRFLISVKYFILFFEGEGEVPSTIRANCILLKASAARTILPYVSFDLFYRFWNFSEIFLSKLKLTFQQDWSFLTISPLEDKLQVMEILKFKFRMRTKLKLKGTKNYRQRYNFNLNAKLELKYQVHVRINFKLNTYVYGVCSTLHVKVYEYI